MIQFDDHIFQMGWFNHQPENQWKGRSLSPPIWGERIGIHQPLNLLYFGRVEVTRQSIPIGSMGLEWTYGLVYLPRFTKKNQLDIGIYTSPMDPMLGGGFKYFFYVYPYLGK